METRSPPSKIARFADFGIGLESWTMASDGCSREEESPTIGLALELGSGSGHRPSSYKTKACGFTFFQLQELQLQSLIYKYMEAGLPVPYHLVIPIWKSVSNSFTGLSGGLHQLYPSFLGSGHLEFRNGLDPEPGRCRRTDGKKWRCSKEAISDHKYCERHVNRGRHRSRKLVEASPATTIASTATANANTNTNTNLSISLSVPVVNSSSSTGSNLSASPSFGFSPRSVLHGGTQKHEPSLKPS